MRTSSWVFLEISWQFIDQTTSQWKKERKTCDQNNIKVSSVYRSVSTTLWQENIFWNWTKRNLIFNLFVVLQKDTTFVLMIGTIITWIWVPMCVNVCSSLRFYLLDLGLILKKTVLLRWTIKIHSYSFAFVWFFLCFYCVSCRHFVMSRLTKAVCINCCINKVTYVLSRHCQAVLLERKSSKKTLFAPCSAPNCT